MSVDLLRVNAEGKRKIRVTLTSGRVLEDFSQQNLDAFGTNDVGDIYVDVKDLRQVIFPY